MEELCEKPWFHGAITSEEAEKRLKMGGAQDPDKKKVSWHLFDYVYSLTCSGLLLGETLFEPSIMFYHFEIQQIGHHCAPKNYSSAYSVSLSAKEARATEIC
jgi:hypothetical protein